MLPFLAWQTLENGTPRFPSLPPIFNFRHPFAGLSWFIMVSPSFRLLVSGTHVFSSWCFCPHCHVRERLQSACQVWSSTGKQADGESKWIGWWSLLRWEMQKRMLGYPMWQTLETESSTEPDMENIWKYAQLLLVSEVARTWSTSDSIDSDSRWGRLGSSDKPWPSKRDSKHQQTRKTSEKHGRSRT